MNTPTPCLTTTDPREYWFRELVRARERCDHRRASETRRELYRLGWSVAYLEPRPRPVGGGL